MKVISYNVNGIRAAMQKGFVDWLQAANPDILCLQEIKALEEQIDLQPLQELGYNCYWHSAQKKGYSGVAILSKTKPKHIEYETGIEEIDFEGRVIRTDFEEVSVISVYVPSGSNIDRIEFKMQFCFKFLEYIKNLKKTTPNLVICGDYNICHEAIDIHDPKRNVTVSGFLPMEREWLTKFLDECNLLDSFRFLNKEPHNYSWWSYRANARENNKGWRIDYNLVSKGLEKNIKRVAILSEAKHSDHCPVLLEIDL